VNRISREASIAAVLALLLGTLAGLAPSFFAPQPLLSRLSQEAPSLVATCGIALVILCRQIDISIGSQFATCTVVAGLLAAAHVPTTGVVLSTLATGALMGAFNGSLVAILRLPSIVVTLSSMVILKEAIRLKRQGALVSLPDNLQWFGLNQATGQILLLGASLLITAVLAWSLRNLRSGRYLYAVGSDPEAARLAGICPTKTTFAVFVLCGILTATAALMNLVQSPQADPKSGTGLELKAVAAAVIGGIAISGGRGRIWGAALGLLLLANISPALTYLHIQAYWEKAIHGAVILLAVVSDGFSHSRRSS
jgi:rhamnose transport system permease protein